MKIFYNRLILVHERFEDRLWPRFNDNLYLKQRVLLTDWKKALEIERGPTTLEYFTNKLTGSRVEVHIGLVVSDSDPLSGAVFI